MDGYNCIYNCKLRLIGLKAKDKHLGAIDKFNKTVMILSKYFYNIQQVCIVLYSVYL